MNTKALRLAAIAVATGALIASTTTTASAATQEVISTGGGTTLRAIFTDRSGNELWYFGGSACTTTTSDREFTLNDLRTIGWDNRITYVEDYNRCDVRLWTGYNRSGSSTNFVNYGTGKSVPKGFEGTVSSLVVS